MHIRFSSGAAAPPPKQYSHPPILPYLNELVPYVERLGNGKSDDFVMLWAENPRGAVTTFGDVVSEAIKQAGEDTVPLRNKEGKPNADGGKKIADELKRFLSFVRREFSDSLDDNVRMSEEFKSRVNRPWESALNARNLGLSPTNGAWRNFFNFVESHARRPFAQALEAIAQKHNVSL